MELYKALVRFILLPFILILGSCNKVDKKINTSSVEETSINKVEPLKSINTKGCHLSKDVLKEHFEGLKKIYISEPDNLALELYGNANKFSKSITSIFKSVTSSTFKTITKYSLNIDECVGNVNFITDDVIEEDGERYNIESSTQFIFKVVDGRIKIIDIIMAG